MTLNDFIKENELAFMSRFGAEHDVVLPFLESALRDCAAIATDKGVQCVTRFGVTEEGKKWLDDWLGTDTAHKDNA